jgi:hypothetical protein
MCRVVQGFQVSRKLSTALQHVAFDGLVVVLLVVVYTFIIALFVCSAGCSVPGWGGATADWECASRDVCCAMTLVRLARRACCSTCILHAA